MKIGFDLDKIFIDYPPFVPEIVFDWLYKHSIKELFKTKSNSKNLHYKIPSRTSEKWLRKAVHVYFLRPPITPNVDFIKNFPKNPHHHDLYLISSRYSFLENQTYQILKRYNLLSPFVSINLNTKDEQPHLFKAKKIKELGIELYIDDDLDLLKYLKDNCPKLRVLWYNPKLKDNVYDNIPVIHTMDEIRNFLPK